MKKAGPGKMKMGGTGSKQEDQIVTVALEKQTGTKFIYIPYKGGGEVATQLVGKHIDSIGEQPDRGRGAMARRQPPAAVRVRRAAHALQGQDHEGHGWGDIPTCKEAGVNTDYVMLRGIFMPGGVTPDQVKYYVDLLEKVRQTPEWKKFMEDGAFNQTALTGKEYADWVAKAEKQHYDLMKEAGFLAQGK